MNDIIQGSSKWLELRKQYITGTDASIIMHCNPWRTPYALWRQKMDLDPPEEENQAMRRGTELEPIAREWFIQKTGIYCEPKVVFKDFMMASLDGLSSDQKSVVEIKCGSKAFAQAEAGEIAEYYMCQLMHQMECANVNKAYYVAFNGKEGIVLHVHRDQNFINQMIKKEREFYECLVSFTPPPMTNKDYCLRTDESWIELAENYRLAYQELKEAEKLEKELKEKLIELAAQQSSMGSGIKLSKIAKKGTIDYSLIPELKEVNLEPYRKKTIEYWKITLDS